MRSEPGRVMVRTATGGRIFPASRSSCVGLGGGALDGDAAPAAPAAAFFRKPRRPTDVLFDFAMVSPPFGHNDINPSWRGGLEKPFCELPPGRSQRTAPPS